MQEKGIRARNKAATQQRSLLAGAGEMDTESYNRALHTKDKDDAKWIRTVTNLSTWTDYKKACINEDADVKCTYCGATNPDIVHLLWKCSFFQAQRTNGDPDLKDLCDIADTLPAALKLGMPPAIPATADHSLWKGQGDWNGTKAWPAGCIHKGDIHCLTKDLINKYTLGSDTADPMNARQLVAALRRPLTPLELTMPQPCDQPSPLAINVYTDGTLKHPRLQDWALGGMGVWWPNRQLNVQPLNRNEDTYAHATAENKGVSLWGTLNGTKASSCRTEIAGAILATLAEGPIHQGSDSMSFTSKANAIKLHQEKSVRKCFVQSHAYTHLLDER